MFQRSEVFVADNPSGPSNPTKWHTSPHCPSISGISSAVSPADLEHYGIDSGSAGLCGQCKRRLEANRKRVERLEPR